MDQEIKEEVQDQNQEMNEASEDQMTDEQETSGEEESATDQPDMEAELSEAKDKYLRLYSEFENFRRRTSREKLDLVNTASRDLMTDLLPVLDDFERAFKAVEGNEEENTASEGLEIIYNKFSKTLTAKGLKEIPVKPGDEFDEAHHEAITEIPAPSEDLAGKIVDIVEKGYFLNDKVIRFAKVVTGASK